MPVANYFSLALLTILFCLSPVSAQQWEEWSVSLNSGPTRVWIERPAYTVDAPTLVGPGGGGDPTIFTGGPRLSLTGYRTDLELRYGTDERSVFGLGLSHTHADKDDFVSGAGEYPLDLAFTLRDDVSFNELTAYFGGYYHLTPSTQRLNWQVGGQIYYAVYNYDATNAYVVRSVDPGGLTVVERSRRRRYDTTQGFRLLSRWSYHASPRVALVLTASGGYAGNNVGSHYSLAGQFGLSYSLTGPVEDF